MSLRAEQQVCQKVQLAQHQIQSLVLLSLAAGELEEYLEQASLDNPLIELVYPEITVSYDAPVNSPKSAPGQRRDDLFDFVQTAEGTELSDYLMQQLAVDRYSKADYLAIKAMVSCIDESGYLLMNDEVLAAHLGMSVADTSRVRGIIQQLEPAGIAARSLQECLALQLERLYPEELLAHAIVTQHLAAVAKSRVSSLSGELHKPKDEIAAAFNLIKTLNPKPGSSFGGWRPLYVMPDIVVNQQEDLIEVELSSSSDYRILVDKDIRAMVRESASSKDKLWIEGKYREANMLKTALHQRRLMLLMVSRAVIEKQRLFFNLGPDYLVESRMTDLAEEMGVSVSTVSRAVKDKYLQCRWGCFPLKEFFRHSTADKPVHKLKYLIRELISKEPKGRPLSDSDLVKLLKEANFDASRRSVARYRDELRIPSSQERRYSA